MTTTIPDAFTSAFDDDDQQVLSLTPVQHMENWKRTATISASKILHGYCGQPECPCKRPAGLELTCGNIECARWMRSQPQVFYDHFLPIYNGTVGIVVEDDEEEEEADPVEYAISRRMLALFGLATALGGGVVAALVFALGARIGWR